MTTTITPDYLVSVSKSVTTATDDALMVGQNYLATQQNAMGAQTWSGDGTTASHVVATKVSEDLTKVLNGGRHLADGLFKAAQIMAAGDMDDKAAYEALFGDGAWHPPAVSA